MLDYLLDDIPVRGRKARAVSAEVVRELDETDLGVLVAEEKGSTPSPIKRISERHHALARQLAAGTTVSEAALICGYDISRVSILQADPTFKELVEFYRQDITRETRGLHERMYGLSMEAAAVLSERLEEESEKISVGQLIEVLKMGADRTGFGPQSTSTNLNVNVDLANRLEEARKRVKERRYTPMIEAEKDK